MTDPKGDTKRFGDLVASMVEERTRRGRRGQTPDNNNEDDENESQNGVGDGRVVKSVGGSLAGSWEKERAELIVDVPVWSPGCFQGMSLSFALSTYS